MIGSILFVHDGPVGIDGAFPSFYWDATRAGLRSYVVPWRAMRLGAGEVLLGGGFEAIGAWGKRWVQGWERVRPSVVLHRKPVFGASETLLEVLAATVPGARVSYHPLYPYADSKWRSEIAFRAAAARGVDIPRPRTWLVGRHEIDEIVRPIAGESSLILKPAAESEGRGIRLSSPTTFGRVSAHVRATSYPWWVVQEIVPNAVLYDGRRCDFRVYALVTSWRPLRVRVYREAVVRVAALPLDGNDPAGVFRTVTSWSFNHRHGVRTVNLPTSYLLEYLRARGLVVSDFWERMEELLEKVFTALRDHANPAGAPPLDGRFYLTGVDVLPAQGNDGLELLFIEHNYVPALVHPNPFVMRFLPGVHRGWVQDLARGAEIAAAPQPQTATPPRRRTIALVDLTTWRARASPSKPLVALGRALGGDSVGIVIAPWVTVATDGRAIEGAHLRVENARVTRAVGRVEVDALLMHPYAGAGALDDEEERAAARRHGLRATDRHGAVAALLAKLGRRGGITNAPTRDGRWGRKDLLEAILCAHTRERGRRVPRPETYAVEASQAGIAIASLHASGCDAIVKPANRARGDGLTLVPIGSPLPPLGAGTVVVQELLRDPLLVDNRKTDLRCYFLLDAARPERSRRLSPVLARRAPAVYERGHADAEITNTSFRARRGLPPDIYLLHAASGIAEHVVREVLARLDELAADFLDAYQWWRSRQERTPGQRLLLWGVDIGVQAVDGGIALALFEVNPHPQLFRDDPACDEAVTRMLRQEYLPAIEAVWS